MRVAFGTDEVTPVTDGIVGHLRAAGHEVDVVAAGDPWPEVGRGVGEAVASGAAERGIALCGSGIGIAIAVNRNPKVRCAQVSEPLSAKLCRSHNDANAIAMGARLIGPEMARACAKAFLETEFEGGRHCGRVDKLSRTPQDA